MINSDLFFFIFNLSHKFYLLDQLMIFGANYVIILMFGLVIILGARRKDTNIQGVILTLISLPLVFLFTKIMHIFFYQPRPFVTLPIETLISHSSSASFPSLHTSIAFTIAFAFLFTKSKWSSIFLVLATWVGFARIFVGVHYPLDILGGILVSLLSVLLAQNLKKFLASKEDLFCA